MTKINWQYRAQEYYDLMHALQSGVKTWMHVGPQNDSAETSPKHLRVGVSSALIEIGALVQTLVEAGVIDYETLIDNKIEMIKKEIADYESKVGPNIRFK